MTAQPSDPELVAAALEGDQQAFGELVARYRDAVFGVAFHRLGDFEAARDAAQETFVKAYLNLASLRNPAAFGAWIRRVANGTALDFTRRVRREIAAEIEASATPEPPEGATGPSVREALQALSEPTRRALILHHVGGYSHAEVAAFLNASPGAVKTRLSRAKAQVKREMVAMVQDALKVTVTVFANHIVLHGKRASCAFGVGSERPLASEACRRAADVAYDLACLDPDLAREPGWRARRREAAAAVIRSHLDGAIRYGANALSMLLQEKDNSGGQPRTLLQVNYSAPGGRSSGWAGPVFLWSPLRQQLARMAGIRLPRKPQPAIGAFSYPFENRDYRVRVALAQTSARIRLQRAQRAPSDVSPPSALARQPADTTARIARTILEQAAQNGAKAVRITAGHAQSRIEVRYLLGDDWQEFMRFTAETKVHRGRTVVREFPIGHPLWPALRQRLAEMAGIGLRPGAARQTGQIRFEFEGKTYDLKAVMTKTTIRVEMPAAES